MAWIELHETVREHKKVYALAEALGIQDAHAVGLLGCLWTWAIANAVDGVLSVPDRAIASAAKWHKSAGSFVKALHDCGWIDTNDDGIYVLHDWYEYAGMLQSSRDAQKEKTKKRVQRYRERKHGVTVTPEVTECNALQALQVTEEKAQSNAPTVPNRTVPITTTTTIDAREGYGDDDSVRLRLAISEIEKAVTGIGMTFAPRDEETANLLIADYGLEWVLLAVERTADRHADKRTWGYIKGILRNWKKQGGVDDATKPGSGTYGPDPRGADAGGDGYSALSKHVTRL